MSDDYAGYGEILQAKDARIRELEEQVEALERQLSEQLGARTRDAAENYAAAKRVEERLKDAEQQLEAANAEWRKTLLQASDAYTEVEHLQGWLRHLHEQVHRAFFADKAAAKLWESIKDDLDDDMRGAICALGLVGLDPIPDSAIAYFEELKRRESSPAPYRMPYGTGGNLSESTPASEPEATC